MSAEQGKANLEMDMVGIGYDFWGAE